MARPEILMIRCYREQYGDVRVSDVPMPGNDIEEAKRAASERLLALFKADHFRSEPVRKGVEWLEPW
jgi:hypothetical protein